MLSCQDICLKFFVFIVFEQFQIIFFFPVSSRFLKIDDSNNDNAGSGVRGNSGCGGRCNKSGGDIDYAGGCNNVTMVVVVVTMVISNFSQWEFTKA